MILMIEILTPEHAIADAVFKMKLTNIRQDIKKKKVKRRTIKSILTELCQQFLSDGQVGKKKQRLCI